MKSRGANILYLTQDGITDHIGQAQIAPYLLELSRLGHSIHIVSAEKKGREEAKRRYRELFERAGVRWTFVRYSNRPPLLSTFRTLLQMYRAATAIARDERPDIIHCRSYLPIELGIAIKRRLGGKLLVDFRDFWADVGIEKKPFKFVFRHLKRREPGYFAAADHVVTLTEKAARVLRSWYPQGPMSRGESTVIPCCADFRHFNRKRVDATKVRELRGQLGLGDGPVLLYLGSIGHDYLLAEMLTLFKALLELRPSAKFLFVSNNARELVEGQAVAAGIDREALRYVSVDRAEVPDHIALADLAVVFIRPTLSKAGCSPTKLAELLAMNVPVIANSGVGDVDKILSPDRNCSVVVPDFEPETLRSAVKTVLAADPSERARLRERSAEFTLETGVERYDRIYRGLLGQSLDSDRLPRLREAAAL